MISQHYLYKWNCNRCINPLTNRKIKINGPTYKRLNKLYSKLTQSKYINQRKNKIDLLLLEKLPLKGDTLRNVFKYKYKWNPYNGNILDEDENGPLYFDANTLIHYFYKNRLKYLWYEGNTDNGIFTEGHFGDAVGNGPNFIITGRGKHPDWYLFRLPIYDEYINIDHCYQSVTMGPKLTDEDINNIYKSSNKKRFKKLYGYDRPNIVKMKSIYEKCIDSNILAEHHFLSALSNEELIELKYSKNIFYVNKLIKFK